ncbi:MAG: glucan biosynthesis protein [Desulfovibrionaceae bacterium]
MMVMLRRLPSAFRPLLLTVLAGLVLVVLGAARPAPAADGPAFGFDTVTAKAKALAAKPYSPPPDVDPALMKLKYDAWRDIRFKPAESLWRKEHLPIEVQFFHPGFLFRETVLMNTVENGRAKPLKLSRSVFDYGRNKKIGQSMPEKVGAAGFRIHGPINNDAYYDEYLVFLGASYFRAVAKGQHYGLSARGLAVDTAMPRPEEFPIFREFWIQKPAKDDTQTVVYALLDSKSVSGAYMFRVTPGTDTVMDVKAVLFFREPVEKLGLAPLTSMFLYGENTLPCGPQDWRPEVHDSDGMLMHTGYGEWLWRPLSNPSQLMISQFHDINPKGFGLLQRDRDFRDYQDLEADMERRPSVWIEPGEPWGEGHVELFLIPSVEEINDNVACYWVPDHTPAAGGSLAYSYRLYWHDAPGGRPVGGAYVTATRNARLDEKTHICIIDFEGGALKDLPPDAPVTSEIWVGDGGKLLESQTWRNKHTGGWRVSFKIELDHPTRKGCNPPQPGSPVELRAYLKQGQDVLSETWSWAVEP